MKITDAVNDLQLLSNIGDLAVAGSEAGGSSVDSCAVLIKFGEVEVLDETLYSDEDGTVWIRDVRSLLLPYMTPADVSIFTIKVDSTTYTIKVMYCLAEIVTDREDTNLNMLRAMFPVTTNKKTVYMGASEALPVFGYYNPAQYVQMTVACLYSLDGGDPTTTNLSISMYMCADVAINNKDVSPSVILHQLAVQLSKDDYRLKLFGYRVYYETNDYLVNMIYSVSMENPGLKLRYRNAFGAYENVSVYGGENVDRDYSIVNAYKAGKLKRIDSSLTAEHTFTLPLSGDSVNAIAEAIIMSPELQLLDREGEWRDIAIIGYSHETDSILSSGNEISFTWRMAERNNRTMISESSVFDISFDKTYN